MFNSMEGGSFILNLKGISKVFPGSILFQVTRKKDSEKRMQQPMTINLFTGMLLETYF